MISSCLAEQQIAMGNETEYIFDTFTINITDTK